MNRSSVFSTTALALSLSLVSCTRAANAPPKDPTPAVAKKDFAVGEKVEVMRHNQWFPSTVLKTFGDKFLIHYESFGDEWNETVGLDRIRGKAPAAPPAPARDYKVGDKVIVQMANRHAFGEITHQVNPVQWRVHYDGYGAEVGEVVGPERLARPFAGEAPHAIGKDVGVEFNGQVIGGKIAALVAADRFIVRFAAFGPDYDQEVGAERLRPAPPAPPPVAAAPAPHPAPPATGGPGLKAGDSVFVSQRGPAYVPAVVVGSGPGTWRVRYEGATGEEDVPADRVARAPDSAKGVKFTPSQNVYIEWHGMFVTGRVVKEQEKGLYRCRFDGQGPEADEIVPTRRLRPR